jgi:flagellar biosynthesis/type III secretory pathway chaperone
MTSELIAAAVRLADTLAQENRALSAMDLPRAAGMLDDKTRALEAFAAAQLLAERGAPGALASDRRAEAEQLAARLRDLAQENQRLLEHAIAVQGRVIGLLARAIPDKQSEQGGARYGADGGLAGPKPGAIAFSARA